MNPDCTVNSVNCLLAGQDALPILVHSWCLVLTGTCDVTQYKFFIIMYTVSIVKRYINLDTRVDIDD